MASPAGVVQRGGRCPNVQGQVGLSSEPPGPVEGFPAHNDMVFKVPSIPNHSGILPFYVWLFQGQGRLGMQVSFEPPEHLLWGISRPSWNKKHPNRVRKRILTKSGKNCQ